MPRAILVILDGLRRDLVTPQTTPRLAAFAERAEQFAAHRTVFPSCTRVVSASLATGCHPARHGLQGNTMALMENGRLVRHDAGRPDFLQHKRRVTGRALAVPTLAERLGVNRSTIVHGYRELAADGLIEQRVGSGSRVAALMSIRRRLPPAPCLPVSRLGTFEASRSTIENIHYR